MIFIAFLLEELVKASRVIQFILLAIIAVYLIMVHSTNTFMVLPLFFFNLPVSPALVMAGVFLLGWIMGWLPTQTTVWRKSRESRKLQKRVTELEDKLPAYAKDSSGKQPIIPDRTASDELSA